MRKLVLVMSVSLDGFVAGPKGELDWIPGEATEENARYAAVLDLLRNDTDTIVLGRVAYEDMSPVWPHETHPMAVPMNELPKLVFSKSLQTAAWNNTRITSGDLREEITRLKQQPGKNIVTFGGADFVQSLSNHGLVDEYRLTFQSVVLGRGLPLFKGVPAPITLKLVDTMPLASGAVGHTYQRA